MRAGHGMPLNSVCRNVERPANSVSLMMGHFHHLLRPHGVFSEGSWVGGLQLYE